jgi:hypothetical protein
VIRPLSALGQALLLAALLVVPGLGTVDFCMATDQICREAEAGACCCDREPQEGPEVPCCITVHQDWMLPAKEVAKAALPLLPTPPAAWNSEFDLPAAVALPAIPRLGSPEPPPPSRRVYLALIQTRLV